MTDCAAVRELLPWHLNGTLEGDEAAEVAAHLEECAACREELAATGRAAEVFAAHPSAASVAAWAAGEVSDSSDAVAAHLATCSACREEVALAAAGLAELEDPPPSAGRGRRGWWMGPAAVLVVAVAAGLIWLALQRGMVASRTRVAELSQRVDRLENEARQLQDRTAAAGEVAARARRELDAARRRVAAGSGARLDVRVLELLPGAWNLRAAGPAKLPRVSADRLLSVVLVRGDPRPFPRYRLTARDRSGRTRWQANGLTTQPDGDVALVVPAGQLGEGELRLALEGAGENGQWEKVGEYRLVVTAAGS